MDFTNSFIFLSGLLLCIMIVAGILSNRIGSPLMLVFLGVGLLFGEDGPGGIIFNDMQLAYFVCSFSLAIILFDGGLHTSYKNFRSVFRPAFSLATLGVLLTATVTGLGLFILFDVPLLYTLLFGAIVASTDAAAVFLLLRQRGIKLNKHLSDTLEVESGINDPMAIFLTLSLVQLILAASGETVWTKIFAGFFTQLGIGAAFGYAGGKLLTWFLERVEFESGLYPIFALASALLVFGATNLLGGSGFLAVYIAGLILGNYGYKAKKVVQQFMGGLAWLSQLTMLLVLGLLVTPSLMILDVPIALVVAVLLIFVARPFSVFVSLAFSNFNWREKTFISWVGLRGAIPMYLAMIPVLFAVDGNYFNIAFIVVVSSVILQGWTIKPLAHLLKLDMNK